MWILPRINAQENLETHIWARREEEDDGRVAKWRVAEWRILPVREEEWRDGRVEKWLLLHGAD